MKPLFGIDVTEDKNNDKLNGDEFIVAKPSAANTEALERESRKSVDLILGKRPLSFLHIILLALLIAALISFAIMIEQTNVKIFGIGLQTVMACVLVLCIAAIIALVIFAHRREKEALESDESKLIDENIERISAYINAELGVPANASVVDVLSFSYKIKNGRFIWDIDEEYENNDFSVFADSQNLYLADAEAKYAVPLQSITDISIIRKSIDLTFWNKDVEYDKGEYKQYKISETKLAGVRVKAYCILHFTYGGEEWGIYFPEYEKSVFENLTGIKASEAAE